MNKIEIKDLFISLQSQMQGVLATNSKFIVHPGSEGDSLENAWIELLRNYLPTDIAWIKQWLLTMKAT